MTTEKRRENVGNPHEHWFPATFGFLFSVFSVILWYNWLASKEHHRTTAGTEKRLTERKEGFQEEKNLLYRLDKFLFGKAGTTV